MNLPHLSLKDWEHNTCLRLRMKQKKEKGQFFTPVEIARFMSEQLSTEKEDISVLDPGCGTCVLSCALIERLVQLCTVRSIRLVVYETDSGVIAYTKQALIYLAETLKNQGINFDYVICEDDFILQKLSSAEFFSITTSEGRG